MKSLKISGIAMHSSGFVVSWSDGSVDTVIYDFREDGLYIEGLSPVKSEIIKNYFSIRNQSQFLDPRLKDEVGDDSSEPGVPDTYNGTAEGTVGGINEGQTFTDATMSEMWDSLLKQENFLY